MGGGASLASNTELIKNVPPAVLEKFYKHEKECEENGFTPDETYKFLMGQYQQYLDGKLSSTDSPRARVSKKYNETKNEVIKMKGSSLISPDELLKIIISSHTSDAKDHLQSKGTRERILLERDLHFKLEEYKNLELDVKLDNYSTDILSQMFTGDKCDEANIVLFPKSVHSADNQPVDNMYSDGLGVNSRVPSIDPAHLPKNNQHFCSVCNIPFETATQLTTHVNFSDLHKENLVLAEEQKTVDYRENIRKSNLAKSTVNIMRVNTRRHSYYEKNLTMSKYKFLWFKTINKIIALNCKAYFQKLYKRMYFIPHTVTVLHHGNKQFFRKDKVVTVHIVMYVHTLHNTIEIVLTVTEVNSSKLNPALLMSSDTTSPNASHSLDPFGSSNTVVAGHREPGIEILSADPSWAAAGIANTSHMTHSQSTPSGIGSSALGSSDMISPLWSPVLSSPRSRSSVATTTVHSNRGSLAMADHSGVTSFKPLPRIYLNYSVVHDTALGDNSHTQESGLLNGKFHIHGNLHGHSHHGSAHSSIHLVPAHTELLNPNQSSKNLMGHMVSNTVVTFINSHLKMAKPRRRRMSRDNDIHHSVSISENAVLPDGKGADLEDYTVSFDDAKMSISPLLKTVPSGLVPVKDLPSNTVYIVLH